MKLKRGPVLSAVPVLAGLLGILLWTGCDRNRVYEEYREIPGYNWNRADTVSFDTEIKDTNEAYNLVLNIRNGENYPYRNLYLFLSTGYPDGRKSLDTLEFQFYEENGKALGKCSGDICNNSFLLSENVRFDQAGKYRFAFVHGMRRDDQVLPYVMDIGLRIEKYTAPN